LPEVPEGAFPAELAEWGGKKFASHSHEQIDKMFSSSPKVMDLKFTDHMAEELELIEARKIGGSSTHGAPVRLFTSFLPMPCSIQSLKTADPGQLL